MLRTLASGAAFTLVAAAGTILAAGAEAASPPVQAKTGPGSSTDATGTVVKRAIGRASNATYVYHMASAPAEPRSVVVFLHAWGAVNPVVYGGWIDQLARRGHLVLFPGFQQVGKTRPVEATDVTATLVKDALAALAQDPQARPDRNRVIYLGHSAGAAIALNLAAEAKTRGLPVPKLAFAIMPGGVAKDEASRGIALANLATVDPDTAVVTVVGDREFQAAERVSRRILKETSAVPVGKKLFIRSASDDHGFPALSATLSSPASPKEGYDLAAITVQPDAPIDPKAPRTARPRWAPDSILTGEQTVLLGQLQRNVTDTLDYLAYWKTFDMAAAAALSGGDLAGLRTDAAFADMGRWSDGWPVRRMAVETPRADTTPSASASPATTGTSARAIQSKQPVTRRRETSRSR